MRRTTARATDDTGLSLIEVLVTVVILGIAFVTIVGGMTISIAGSDVHRKQATSQTVLRNLAEHLERVPFDGTCDYDAELVNFTATFTAPGLQPAPSPDAGDPEAQYEVAVTEVANGSYTAGGDEVVVAFDDGAACDPTSGLQRLTLSVRSLTRSELTPETLSVVKRRA